MPVGAVGSISYSPMIVLGQKYSPDHTGFASDVALGLADSVGALFSPLLGKIADVFSLLMTMWVIVWSAQPRSLHRLYIRILNNKP